MKQAGNALRAVYSRELAAYFLTPLAYVFIAIFLIALGAFTFEIGRFFDTNQADLAPFFLFHPWLYLVFLPAIAMRLWADEARGGTLELLLTLPAPTWSLVLGKFLAAWTVAARSARAHDADVDLGQLAGQARQRGDLPHLCDQLPDGGRLSRRRLRTVGRGRQPGRRLRALRCGGLPVHCRWASRRRPPALSSVFGPGLAEAMASFSLITHFEAAQRGVLEMRALVFYGGFIARLAVAQCPVGQRKEGRLMRRSHYAILASLARRRHLPRPQPRRVEMAAPARADFTANGLYTLSSSAQAASCSGWSSRLRLELVYSRSVGAEFPAIRAHADRVRQLMTEIAAQSGGKVKIRETEPEPFSDEEDRIARAPGSRPRRPTGPTRSISASSATTRSTTTSPSPSSPPSGDALLEYELVRLISQLDDPAPPKVAVHLLAACPTRLDAVRAGLRLYAARGAAALRHRDRVAGLPRAAGGNRRPDDGSSKPAHRMAAIRR